MQTQSTGTALFYRHASKWFLVAMIVIAAGFFRSFFLRLSDTDLSHHFHGITATLWLLLLIIQPYLYSKGKISLHKKIGKSAYVLAPLIVIGGLIMMHTMLQSEIPGEPLTIYKLAFLDTFYIIQFIFFFVLAIRHARNTQLHARYMAGTVLLLIPPGLARLLFYVPAVNSFAISLNITYIILEIVLVILLIDDKRSGRIYPPYIISVVCCVLQHIGFNFIHQWEPWVNLMKSFAAI